MNHKMTFREAKMADIDEIMFVRISVKENVLSDPNLIPGDIVEDYIFHRGRGWVCEIEDEVVGFSIVDLKDNNVWALFVLPGFESRGIGKKLHDIMLDWYFLKSKENLWLGTTSGSRAEKFYRQSGWNEIGTHGNDEIKFEMTYTNWVQQKRH